MQVHSEMFKNNYKRLSMKIRANDIDLIDAERFDSFSTVIFNCKIKYCCFNKKLNSMRLKLKTSVKFV